VLFTHTHTPPPSLYLARPLFIDGGVREEAIPTISLSLVSRIKRGGEVKISEKHYLCILYLSCKDYSEKGGRGGRI